MKLILFRLGRFLVHVGALVQIAALKWAGIVPLRSSAPLTSGMPAESWPHRHFRLPTVEELDAYRARCIIEDLDCVKVCRGPAKGCPGWPPPGRCADCYVVPWHDTRPSVEILRAIERGDA